VISEDLIALATRLRVGNLDEVSVGDLRRLASAVIDVHEMLAVEYPCGAPEIGTFVGSDGEVGVELTDDHVGRWSADDAHALGAALIRAAAASRGAS
jgi:hypothetical protein